MDKFFKKYSTRLKTVALLLMLGIPFLVYAAASYGSLFQVKLLLGLMSINMLYVMIKG